AVRDYLYEREQKSGVYLEVEKRVHLKGTGRAVAALCYVVDRRHRQYAGVLPRESQVARILKAVGPSGRNVDYVLNTADILEQEMGIVDGPLHKVAGEVRARLADGVLPPVEPVVLPPLGQRSGPSHPIHEGEPIKRISSDRS
ncbi:MAG: gamma-glutamylcyclotransferase, partial [Pseudomonadota bacterium]